MKPNMKIGGHFSESLGLVASVQLLAPPSQPNDFFAPSSNSGMTRLRLIEFLKRVLNFSFFSKSRSSCSCQGSNKAEATG